MCLQTQVKTKLPSGENNLFWRRSFCFCSKQFQSLLQAQVLPALIKGLLVSCVQVELRVYLGSGWNTLPDLLFTSVHCGNRYPKFLSIIFQDEEEEEFGYTEGTLESKWKTNTLRLLLFISSPRWYQLSTFIHIIIQLCSAFHHRHSPFQ